jgi:chromate reductase
MTQYEMTEVNVMTTANLLGVVGSLRAPSINAATARAAQGLLPEGATMTMFDAEPIPFYNGDVEAVGLPEPVAELHALAAEADGIIFFSPEYNSSFPAVTKNVIDWLSRPPKSWENTAVTMIASTPGPRAGKGVRSHFESIMAFQPVRLFPTLGIGRYREKVDDSRRLIDEQTLSKLGNQLTEFTRFAVDVVGATADVNQ